MESICQKQTGDLHDSRDVAGVVNLVLYFDFFYNISVKMIKRYY